MRTISRDPSLAVGEYVRAAAFPASREPPRDGTSLWWTRDGRSALHRLLRGLGIGASAHVLVPAWICHSVLDPIRAAGADPVFHEVDERGMADPGSVEAGWTDRTRALVVVHPFGFPQALAELSGICRSRGAVLIEDCAHAWLSKDRGRDVGEDGDAAIYSLRKFLPIPDGGALRVSAALAPRFRPPQALMPPRAFRLKAHKDLLDRVDWPGWAAPAARFALGSASMWIRRRPASDAPAMSAPATPSAVLGRYGVPLEQSAAWGLASAARRVIQRADLPSITARRRAVYARLHERLIALPGIRSFAGALGEEVCPWAYPFLPEEREGLDRRLRDRGIQVFTFGDPVGDAAERTRYPRAVSYRERVLLLPSHQGLTDEDVDRMADTLAQVIR